MEQPAASFENHAHRMQDRAFKDKGEQIGRGIVESACCRGKVQTSRHEVDPRRDKCKTQLAMLIDKWYLRSLLANELESCLTMID
jgi:hypothetical protein